MQLNVGLVFVCSVFVGSLGSVLEVISKPDSISLPEEPTSDDVILLSEVPLIASQVLGFSAEKAKGWRGKGDLLDRPECVALFLVTVPDQFKPEVDSKFSYVLKADRTPSFDDVASEIQSTFAGRDFTLKVIKGTEPGAEKEEEGMRVKTKFPLLREELIKMRSLESWVRKNPSVARNHVPDLYLLKIEELISAINKNGPHQPETKEAIKEVGDTIKEVSARLEEVYSGQCFIAMVTQPVEAHERRKRDTDSSQDEPKGLYDFYKPDYPVSFNLIMWTSIFISLTVLFVAVGMWLMEPADSIIYRMTMQRAKKD